MVEVARGGNSVFMSKASQGPGVTIQCRRKKRCRRARRLMKLEKDRVGKKARYQRRTGFCHSQDQEHRKTTVRAGGAGRASKSGNNDITGGVAAEGHKNHGGLWGRASGLASDEIK